ncbi:MAG: hypothetical protein R3F17_13055 [Planctomycetota bacterium]
MICADTLASYGGARETEAFIETSSKIVRVDDTFLAPTGPAAMQLVITSYFSDPDVPRDFSSPWGSSRPCARCTGCSRTTTA